MKILLQVVSRCSGVRHPGPFSAQSGGTMDSGPRLWAHTFLGVCFLIAAATSLTASTEPETPPLRPSLEVGSLEARVIAALVASPARVLLEHEEGHWLSVGQYAARSGGAMRLLPVDNANLPLLTKWEQAARMHALFSVDVDWAATRDNKIRRFFPDIASEVPAQRYSGWHALTKHAAGLMRDNGVWDLIDDISLLRRWFMACHQLEQIVSVPSAWVPRDEQRLPWGPGRVLLDVAELAGTRVVLEPRSHICAALSLRSVEMQARAIFVTPGHVITSCDLAMVEYVAYRLWKALPKEHSEKMLIDVARTLGWVSRGRIEPEYRVAYLPGYGPYSQTPPQEGDWEVDTEVDDEDDDGMGEGGAAAPVPASPEPARASLPSSQESDGIAVVA